MKNNVLLITCLTFSFTAYSQDSKDCVDCVVKPKMEVGVEKVNTVKNDIQKISEYKKDSAHSQWMAKSLSKAECKEILKAIEKEKVNLAIVPQLQSAVEVLKAECGEGEDPKVVAVDAFPFTIKGTDLFLSWNEKNKLVVDLSKKPSADKNLKIYDKIMMETGDIVLTDDQKKLIDKKDLTEHADKLLPKQTNVKRWWNVTKDSVSEIMNEGNTDVYLPMLAYHDRNTYTPDKVAELNEGAYGFGMGKSKVNENGNTEMLYVMAHLDSHSDVEVNAGYGWVKKIGTKNVKVGAGYAAGLFSRSDIGGRVPFPFVLPMATIDVGNASVNAILIPKLGDGINHGNVLFVFGKYTWDKKKKK